MGQNEDICAQCHKEIKGGAMKAKDRLYHDDTCFKCTICGLDLKEVPVYSKDDSLFCEEHYKAKYVPKCAKCGDFITEDCVRALDRTWHSAHFSCDGCDLNFSAAQVGFHENEGKALCEKCYTNNVLPKCQGCKKPITDRTMKAMGGQWHVTCFVCKDCQCTFEGQKSFYSIDDQPVCGPCAGIGEEPQE